MAIRYIIQKDINYSLWDKCIGSSLNGSIYGFSWYLDIVAEHWDALVEDDYRAVMPLPYNMNFIYKKLYAPVLASQLGVFSEKPLEENKIEEFLSRIPRSFKKINICLNRQNTQTLHYHYHYNHFKTYELDLIIPYEKKCKSYLPSVKTGIDEALKRKLSVVKGTSLYDFENFIKNSAEGSVVKALRQILSRLLSIGRAEIIGVYNASNNLCSVACFVRSNQSVVLLYAFSVDEGANSNSNYILLDNFLKNYSGRNVTLCFDHIDLIWNSNFYKDFGALESTYVHFTENRLPWYLKWLISIFPNL